MKKSLLLILLLWSTIVSAQNKQSIPQYFPAANAKNDINSFENKWFSEQLYALAEPVLFNSAAKNEIYRFTWLRTFHHPVAIRIERKDGKYILSWKMSDGAGGYDPGKLIKNESRIISQQVWDNFKIKLSAADFWALPTDAKDLIGNDGSQWILEAQSIKKYHVVNRWTPDPSTDYYKCCDYLIGLTRLNFSENEKY